MLASTRSKTGGAAVLCCRARGDAAALLTVSKPEKKTKKTMLDMEAFEKELHESKVKDVEEDEGAEAQPEEADETELGDDPFARGEVAAGLDAGNEPWLKSDRDYTYPEVRPRYLSLIPSQLTCLRIISSTAPPTILRPTPCVQSRPPYISRKAIHHRSSSTRSRR